MSPYLGKTMNVFEKHSVYDAGIDKNKVIAYLMSVKDVIARQ